MPTKTPTNPGQTDISLNLLAVQYPPLPLSLTDIKKWDTFSILAPTKTMGSTPLWLLARHPAITVKENLTDEDAGATIQFRLHPQRILVAGSGDDGDAYSISWHTYPTAVQHYWVP